MNLIHLHRQMDKKKPGDFPGKKYTTKKILIQKRFNFALVNCFPGIFTPHMHPHTVYWILPEFLSNQFGNISRLLLWRKVCCPSASSILGDRGREPIAERDGKGRASVTQTCSSPISRARILITGSGGSAGSTSSRMACDAEAVYSVGDGTARRKTPTIG